MEEQKKNNEAGQETQNPPKYTYEQLNDICGKLFQENQYLKQQLQRASSALKMFNRLDYLFRIVEDSNSGSTYNFSSDFVLKCVAEIEEAMAVPEKEDKEEN
jgi:hypothetical protein